MALSPDRLPLCASLAGLAERVHCDLQPVDATRGEVTFTTSQVSEGCVAQVANAAYEVHVLFLDFPKVSTLGRVGADRQSQEGIGVKDALPRLLLGQWLGLH